MTNWLEGRISAMLIVLSYENTKDTRFDLNHGRLIPLYSNTYPCLFRVVFYTINRNGGPSEMDSIFIGMIRRRLIPLLKWIIRRRWTPLILFKNGPKTWNRSSMNNTILFWLILCSLEQSEWWQGKYWRHAFLFMQLCLNKTMIQEPLCGNKLQHVRCYSECALI